MLGCVSSLSTRPPTCSLFQPRGFPTQVPIPAPNFLSVEPWQKPPSASVFLSVEWGWDSSHGRPQGSIPVGWGLQMYCPREADPILV